MDDGLPRRDFLKAAGRLLALGGIGILAARVLGRAGGKRRPAGGETCSNEGLCRGCGAFAGCGLPQALSARERTRLPGGAPGRASGTPGAARPAPPEGDPS